ncbi:LLM class flavin-dependent oxidoreductase [Nocardioides hwasunensis]|uniref:LLM class flavin-dependent oxidoreductase n=1 Tax=Nocardioides hwasunensis TaxID=397258 RepID=A0ABR8MG56_9ACTN|nr:LLM class flavin-dependent oxidoreductase [Nocardioides hwasunensis]MBD3915056.1 LLM class flavin-dependent oxidoreductase [Nocardioides hwasunensis]
MSAKSRGLKFGVFTGPYHLVGVNPTLAIRRDLEIVDHLDALGFHEIWFGEHHSSGVETIASPELMIAAAAERTKHIRLGTGVSSLPYHHPFMLADRIVQLDHMTRGRMMFGVGPGQLLQDATTLGIEPSTQRERMEEALGVMLRLFAGETVTHESDWFILRDGALQLRPYSDFEIAVTAAVSPTGPKLAGRLGLSLLSLAATDPAAVDRLAGHWDVLEVEAQEHGHVADRSTWRLMGPMHIAESLEQAKKNMEHGFLWLMNYMKHVSPTTSGEFTDISELVDVMNETGKGVIGTPEMAVAQLKRLEEKSGGYGTYLMQGADYASFSATMRSYELFAEQVMPHFTGALESVVDSHDRLVASAGASVKATSASQAAATARYQAERETREPTGARS